MTKICLMCGDTFPDTISFCAKDGSALRAAVVGDHLIGEVFCDRYVVTDLLGEGGMGAVYAARDVRLPQQVAIKVLREQGMADPSTVARFKQEAEAASRINHDRVARVTDFGFMNDGRAYLVMEYVGGRTLKQVVSDRGPMDASEVSRIVTMVAEGLDAAHRLGIIHRDLKPDNVMILDDAGGGVRVKVLDFGIAKVLQSDGESAGRTQTGFVIGTPQWMSPEQILGETLDGRSDVYALGLLAYTMLTGRRAFESASAEAEMMARLTSLPRPLAELVPSASWPVGLQELLNQTLSRDVNDRPSGALAFAKEFAGVVGAGNMITPMTGVRAMDNSLATAESRSSLVQTGVPVAAPGASTVLRSRSATSMDTNPSSTALLSDSSFSNTSPARSKAVPIALGVAVIAALTFFAMRQFSGNGALKATGTANVPIAGAPTIESGAAAITETPTSGASPAGKLPAATPNARNQRVPDAAARTKLPPGAASGTTTLLIDSAKGATERASLPGAPASPPSNQKAATAASIELKHLMDLADIDFADKDLNEINNRIRRFESLLPELATPTDKGNAHLYIAMSHSALRDNAKACASLSLAKPLASQSSALRDNVEGWQQVLKCFP